MTYERIEYLETVFGGMTIGRYLNAILSQFLSQEKLDEIKGFFEKRPIKQAERSIAQGILLVYDVIIWRNYMTLFYGVIIWRNYMT